MDQGWRSKIVLRKGDLTEAAVDAIVNAANNDLILGGGVAGAIRAKGGPSIQAECDKLGPISIGEAAITGGRQACGALRNSRGDRCGLAVARARRALRESTRNSLRRAAEQGLESIAFPAIGTGIAGFPIERCAEVMLEEIRDHLRAAGRRSGRTRRNRTVRRARARRVSGCAREDDRLRHLLRYSPSAPPRAATRVGLCATAGSGDHQHRNHREDPVDIVEGEDRGLRLDRAVNHPERLMLPADHLRQVIERRRARHARRARRSASRRRRSRDARPGATDESAHGRSASWSCRRFRSRRRYCASCCRGSRRSRSARAPRHDSAAAESVGKIIPSPETHHDARPDDCPQADLEIPIRHRPQADRHQGEADSDQRAGVETARAQSARPSSSTASSRARAVPAPARPSTPCSP